MLGNRNSAEPFPLVNEGPPARGVFSLVAGPTTDDHDPEFIDYDDEQSVLEFFIPGGGPGFCVPPELRGLTQWVGWKSVQRDGPGKKATKVPVSPRTGHEADTTDPSTWGAFTAALDGAVMGKWDGIGFVFTPGDPYVGIDLDDVIDPATGEIDPDALATVERFGSYAELSPSGTGIHIIVRGQLPPGGRKRGDRECYDRGRYFTFTADLATPYGIADGGAELAKWHAETFPANDRPAAPSVAPRPVDLSDQQLLAKIGASKQGPKFAKLWAGDTSDYPSGSEADLALCNILAFWTDRDPARMDRLFRCSGLIREKWDRKRGESKYGQRTIAEAIAGTSKGYRSDYTAGTDPRPVIGPSPTNTQAATGTATEPRFKLIDSATFFDTDYRAEFLISKAFARGQPCIIGGPHKTLKTSLIVDMGVSMATGTKFLGHFEVKKPVRVAIASGESGAFTLKETFKRVCAAKGVNPRSVGDWLRWEFTLPVLSDRVVMDDFAGVLNVKGVEVVFIDPAYLCLGDVDAKNVFEVGKVLREVATHLLARGVTPVIAHHANKLIQAKMPMELNHLSYSGFAEFARQWVLLNRREPFKGDGVHDIWLTIGGSAGHGGQWNLHVEEGTVDEDFNGRRWDVSLQTPDEVREGEGALNKAEKEYAKQKQQHYEAEAVMKVIDEQHHTGGQPLPLTAIAAGTGWERKKVKRILSTLVKDRIICEVPVKVNIGSGAVRSAIGYCRLEHATIGAGATPRWSGPMPG